MIDEGHDFEADWLQLATQMVSPEINSLLLLYDDAQNLYGKVQKRKFTFKSVGIQAQGRTTILKSQLSQPSRSVEFGQYFRLFSDSFERKEDFYRKLSFRGSSKIAATGRLVSAVLFLSW